MMDDRIRVLCVDDNPDLAGLLSMSVDFQPDMASVGCLHRADELVEEVGRTGAQVVILDLTMPGKDPMEALREVRARHPETRTIVFSGHDDDEVIDRALAAGALACVRKGDDPEQILDAVRRAARGTAAVRN